MSKMISVALLTSTDLELALQEYEQRWAVQCSVVLGLANKRAYRFRSKTLLGLLHVTMFTLGEIDIIIMLLTINVDFNIILFSLGAKSAIAFVH